MYIERILKSRLHRKILFMMLAVGVVPVVVAGGVAYYSVTQSQYASVNRVEESLLGQKANEVQNFINDIVENTFNIITGYEQTTDISSSSQRFLLSGSLSVQPALEEVSLISLGNQEVVTGKITAPGEETTRYGRLPSGESVQLAELRNVSKLAKFEIARSGAIYFGSVYYSLRGPIMTIASPVKNKNGVIVSVMSGELNLSKIARGIIGSSRLGSSGYLYLVDQDGFLIGSSGGPTFSSLRNVPFVAQLTHGTSLNVNQPQTYLSFFGSRVIASGAFIPNVTSIDKLKNLKWVLIAEWPIEDAYQILYDLQRQVLIFSIVVLLLTAILSVFLAARIVGPIKVLEGGTERISAGKFDVPIILTTGDELEELGAAFNEMMKGLKRLQELKDEFVFVAAHELRTPVAAIKGYLTLVLQGFAGPVNDSVKSFIDKVMTANTRLIRLVDDLLEVARSDAGRLTISVAPIDIVPPIHATLSELKPLADEKSIELIYEPKEIPKVMADADRIKEVMVNLLGNAIKYTIGKGRVTITHEVRTEFKGTHLITRVADTGMGISKEAQKKLFEKFYRVQTEETRNITGTGLGLFIVKELVEKMNGTIWVESEEGKGSIFSFSLPAAG